MNAHSQTLRLSLEGYQVEEAVASIFHTVLLHRTCGKFHYQHDYGCNEGSVGFKDVDCDFVDLTYVRCQSPALDRDVKRKVSEFSKELRSNNGIVSGEISLKFFRKKKSSWLFEQELIPWEIWSVQLDLIDPGSKETIRETVGELLEKNILFIAELIDKCQYVPAVPSWPEVCLIFDLSYEDCQPYLHEITHVSSSPSSPTFSSLFRNVFR